MVYCLVSFAILDWLVNEICAMLYGKAMSAELDAVVKSTSGIPRSTGS